MPDIYDSIVFAALVMGLISALSLPLGAVTSIVWRPTDRSMAVLMAFGGGALLAALTIDLVGSAVEKGHFYALAIGALIGGSLFLALNQVVNDYGGFLRKASTTIYYLRRKQHQRIRQITRQMNQVDLFEDLETRDFKALAASVRTEQYRKGHAIYQAGDPPESVYIVESGTVELFDPQRQTRPVETLGKNDVFGWKACIIGAPTAYTAITREDTVVWVIPKSAIESLVLNQPVFMQGVHRLLRSNEILDYLQNHQGMSFEQATRWLDTAAQSLNKRGVVPPAQRVRRNAEAFVAQLERVRRFPLIHGLPPEEQDLIAEHLVYKHYHRGDTFFHRLDPCQRMFFIENGEVQLIDPAEPSRKPPTLQDSEAFGSLSMLTGARHSYTAIAAADTTVWELRRQDFEHLLRQAPEFEQRVRAYLQRGDAGSYLEDRHHFDTEKAARWTREALRSMDSGKSIPLAADLVLEVQQNHGAPLAIWLGITLDGIPESLVIGASMVQTHVSVSLIAGLFLANYPEALSSSVGMRQQGMSYRRILFMWTSLMILTGVGAALGSLFFVDASPTAFALIEGLAAGAMLTMIAETMLPEAYFKGGSVVGMSTLCGFLAAIFFKTLE